VKMLRGRPRVVRTSVLAAAACLVGASAFLAATRGDASSNSGAAPAPIAQLAPGASQGPASGSATRGSSSATSLLEPIVLVADHHDTSLPLSVLATLPIEPPPVIPLPERQLPPAPTDSPAGQDMVRQPYRTSSGPLMPAPVVNFDGVLNSQTSCTNCFPPDTEGDVGPNHYFQWVNTSFRIFNKSGVSVLGPALGNSIWSGFGGLCETTNRGDPVVLYDGLAGRWLVSQFAFNVVAGNPAPPFMECIAISQTSDPTGAYHRYGFTISNTLFNDYPHFGVWPDAYYMSINQFNSAGSFTGFGAVAFERDKMLNGQAANALYFNTTQQFAPLATDLDGSTLPPPGADGLLFGLGSTSSQLARWQINVDWTTPTGTMTGPTFITVAAFDATNTTVPQPNPPTAVRLDSIMDRLMFRNAYRNFGTHESVVLNHTVRLSSTRVGVRWYEIRSPYAAAPTVHQQSTYSGDVANTDSRWMGSIAMDNDGDIALGYSVSGPSTSPSVRYVGRLSGDVPLSTLPQGETTLIAGAGAQTGQTTGGISRWGDYSMMGIDPIDDCTFWYTQEYYSTTALVAWRTRIGSFKFPSCAAPTAVKVLGFTARATRRSVALSWNTTSEADVLGFNVWRIAGKRSVKVNGHLIPAKQSGRAAGGAYRLVDRRVVARRAYSYRLQLVTLKRARTWSGGITVATR
jgi:hypothetical protein